MIANDVSTYKKDRILNMNQQQLIVYLYESALRLMEEAKPKKIAKDVNGTHEKLDRTRRIFLHLIATLNLEAGEFAEKMSALYAYFVEKITVANVTKEISELDDIIPMVAELKDAWNQMEFDESKSKAAMSDPLANVSMLSVEA